MRILINNMKYVLLISNEPFFLQGYAECLGACSVKLMVINANTMKKALEILKTAKMDAVAVDITISDLEKSKLIQHLRLRYPELPVMLMSVPTRLNVDWRLLNDMIFAESEYTTKPAHPRDIAESILSFTKKSSKDSRIMEPAGEHI